MMQHEHREYSLQKLPLEKMKCVIKSYDGSLSGSRMMRAACILPAAYSLWTIAARYINILI